MKLAVVGSRTIYDKNLIFWYLDSFKKRYQNIELVLSGGARGVDSIAVNWAKLNGIEVKVIRPDYDSYPPRIAPIIRNKEIVNYSDHIIAFWDGKSRGTSFVIDYAKSQGKRLSIFKLNNQIKNEHYL